MKFFRRHHYDELAQTIREHLEEKIGDLTDGGLTRDEAEAVMNETAPSTRNILVKNRARFVVLPGPTG
jgi:hypothetical protein